MMVKNKQSQALKMNKENQEIEFISMEELKTKTLANRKFFELLETYQNKEDFLTNWNVWAENEGKNEMLDFSYFDFNQNNEEIKETFEHLLDNDHDLNFSFLTFPVVNFTKAKITATFEGAKFTNNAKFNKAEFSGTFCEATFEKEVSFFGTNFDLAEFYLTKFKEGANFANAKFNKNNNFTLAEFNSRTNFDIATFKEEANFNQTSFEEGVSFNDATFEDCAIFNQASLKNIINFEATSFNGEAQFHNVISQGKTYFWKATFKNEISFQKSTFEDRLIFLDCVFRDRADFSKVTLGNRAHFRRTVFENEVIDNDNKEISYFRKIARSDKFITTDELKEKNDINKHFFDLLEKASNKESFQKEWNKWIESKDSDAKLDFSNFCFDLKDLSKSKTFENLIEEIKDEQFLDFSSLNFLEITFQNSTFKNKVNFSNITFANYATFANVNFEKEIDFSNTIFNDDASFWGADFKRKANFSDLKFESENTLQAIKIDFRKTTFEDNFEISFNKNSQKSLQETIIDFDSAEFLSYSKFDITNLRTLPDFSQASFPNPFSFDLRDDKKILDEKFEKEHLLNQENANEENFRFLKKHYHEEMDFKKSHFYFVLEIEKNNEKAIKNSYEKANKTYPTLEEKTKGSFLSLKRMIPFKWKVIVGCPSPITSIRLFPYFLYKTLSDYGMSVRKPMIFLILLSIFFGLANMTKKNIVDPKQCYEKNFVINSLKDSIFRSATLMPLLIRGNKSFNFNCYSKNLIIIQSNLNYILWFLFFLAVRNKFQIK